MGKQERHLNDTVNIALSSRIRLARNISAIHFPWKMDEKMGMQVAESVRNAVALNGELDRYGFGFKFVYDMDEEEKNDLLANHLISLDLIKNPKTGGILISGGKTVSILVNEEDHLRIQTLVKGLNLDDAWNEADSIDDSIEENLDYAFDGNYGYLTACPSNIGTGMRASVMLHLPALASTKYIKKVFGITNTIGLTVRGLYGEGTDAEGDIYQISNQITTGRTEAEIIGDLERITKQVIEKERKTREYLAVKQKTRTEDIIFRALGILSNSRLINRAESMKLLSRVRLGIDMGFIGGVDMNDLDILIKDMQTMGKNETLESAEKRSLKTREFFQLRR
ncbi:MAG TPA: protein arginine kinase [Clostridia bacterium]|nr:protein arginine kinase [Clostridia bacterium]